MDDNDIAGYYTLATASVPLTGIPAHLARKMPRYPCVPAVRMGPRSGYSISRSRVGGTLWVNALHRAVRSEIPAVVLVVDAKDEHAANFYRHYGFIPLGEQPLTLFFPLASMR